MSLETRAVIHFFWCKGTSNQAIFSKLQRVYGTNAPTLRAIQKWTANFANGRSELADLPRPGRPRDPGNVDAVRELIESEGFLSQKQIGHMLGFHHDTVKRILCEDLQMRKVNCKWIPHTLSSSQKAARVQVSKDLLEFLEGTSDRNLCNVYTGDETWVYMDNPRVSMWTGADVARPTVPRRTIGTKKCMFWIEFSRSGIGTVVILPPGQSFNRDFFLDNVLLKIVDDRALRRPRLKARGTFLHLDNARPHLCNDAFEDLGIKRLPHPPYSPDLAPCDFWLFGYLKQCLEGQSFDSPIALQAAVSEILMSIEVGTFVRVFTEWKRRLLQCIEQGGDYL
jgi:histone-lysine N-methyltransferase SETMAR